MAKTKQVNVPNYMERGSDDHMHFLGLRKAVDKDEVPQMAGLAMMDITQYGPAARPEFLTAKLRGKVGELNNKMPPVQSKDRRQPNYAQPIWQADEDAPRHLPSQTELEAARVVLQAGGYRV